MSSKILSPVKQATLNFVDLTFHVVNVFFTKSQRIDLALKKRSCDVFCPMHYLTSLRIVAG